MRNKLFKAAYAILAIITLAALATPPALAASILPDSNVGALIMIGAVGILMSVLVIEIWRQTGKDLSIDQPNPVKRVKRSL